MLKDNHLLRKANLNSIYNYPEYVSTLQSTAFVLANIFCYVLVVSFCSFLIMGTAIISIFSKYQINLPLLCHYPSLVYSLYNPK